jgi:hypothetical protein
MEDIIALAIIAIIPVVVVYGAVLLRRRFVRRKEQKLKLYWERIEAEANQRQEHERQRIKEMRNVTPVYANLGNAAAQSTANITPYSTPGGGTTSTQPVSNRTSDLFTGMAIGGLISNLFGTSHAKSNTDVGWDDSNSKKSSSSSWSDSSSNDSSSSDSGPSSDW